MPGSQWMDVPLLRAAAEQFGWTMRTVLDVGELRDEEKIGAVFFQQDSLGSGWSWLGAIAKLKTVAPEARLVACTHFSDADEFPKLCRAGLFHSLWLPLKQCEVLQCMGFVWAAEKRGETLAKRPVHLVKREARRAAS